MKPGPPPKPRHLRLVTGNPGKRPLPPAKPEPTTGADCPPELSAAAKKEWARVAPELLRLKLLTVLDRAALAGYCEAYSDYCWAIDAIERVGRTQETDTGYVVVHPAVTIKKQSLEAIRQMAAEFGFTPSARGRIEFPATEPEDPDDARFFAGRPAPPPAPRPRGPKPRA